MDTDNNSQIKQIANNNMNTDKTNGLDESFKRPDFWFSFNFPEVYKKHGPAVDMKSTKDAVSYVSSLNEDFLADTLGVLGNPNSPTVYVASEDRFFRYTPADGIYSPIGTSTILTDLSALLHKCADDCAKSKLCDTKTLRFQLSKTGQLNGIIKKAQGLLRVSENFFDDSVEEYVACKNGMLRLSDMQLLPFDAKFRRRNKLSVAYDGNAQCPKFMEVLLKQSLDDDDISFLQSWFGLALLGKNKSQVIVILVGTAGGGKSTFTSVLTGVIGSKNVHTLRTERLGDKFETSFYLGKTLLQGVDTSCDFLNQRTASVLKSLTGGDIMNVEIKNAREGGPEITGSFNVVIICNTLPNIRLEGDYGAWKRRLILVEYRKPKPQTVIVSLADMILMEEGSGVLNWALSGLSTLKNNNWQFKLTQRQNDLVDKVLLQSDSPRQFVRKCLVKEQDALLTRNDCFLGYVAYCKLQEWYPVGSTKSNPIIEDEIMRQFGIGQRNDIRDLSGKDQHGWKGIKIKQ